MKKLPLLVAAATVFAAASSLNAASGAFGAYVGVTVDGGSETIYEGLQLSTNLSDIGGADLGTVNVGGNISFTTAEVLTYKNGGSNVNGAQLNYRIYDAGSPTGSFTTTGINFGANASFTSLAGDSFTSGGDQRWTGLTDGSINIASGLDAGDYSVEVYWTATTDGDGSHFINSDGSNFAADFTVVPEPSTYALIAGMLGLAFVALKRRNA